MTDDMKEEFLKLEKDYKEPTDQEINEAVDNFKEGGEVERYHFELFLSTDGKHTVHVTAEDSEGKRKALKVATETFDYILARYGTKQGQAVKEYAKGNGKEISQEDCKHENKKFMQSKTEKNPGRWFASCPDCKKFLGWKD